MLHLILDQSFQSKFITNHLALLTDVNEDLTSIMSNIIVPYNNVLLFDCNSNNYNIAYGNNSVGYYYNSHKDSFIEIVAYFNITKYIFVIITTDVNEIEKYDILSFMKQYVNNTEFCFVEYTVHFTNTSYMTAIAKKLGPYVKNIFVIFNSADGFLRFFEICTKNNVTFGRVIGNTLSFEVFVRVWVYFLTKSKMNTEFNFYSQALNSLESVSSYDITALINLVNQKLSEFMIRNKFKFHKESFLNNKLFFDCIVPNPYSFFDILKRYVLQIKSQYDYEAIDTKKQLLTKCNTICPPAFEQKLLLTATNEEKMQSRICRRCQVNFFKTSYGTNKCEKCPLGYTSNNNNTACLLTFGVDLTFHCIEGIIITLIAAFSTLIGLITAVTFILKRNTPVVKSSNFILSLTQIICYLLVSLLVPLLYVSNNELYCYWRSFIISFLLITATSITYIKTRKYIFIFKTLIRFTKKEKIFSTSIEIMMIGFILIVQMLLAIILLVKSPPVVISYLNYEKKTITFQCTGDSQLNPQVIYIGFMLLICSVQSFYARNLPSYYNETLSITYSTGISFLLLICYFPLYYGNHDIKSRTTAVSILILTTNLILMTVLFTPKIIVIYFKPEMNSKRSIHIEMMNYAKSTSATLS
nr:metabotropic glutamate receptor 5-like [Hydra vulgaris]